MLPELELDVQELAGRLRLAVALRELAVRARADRLGPVVARQARPVPAEVLPEQEGPAQAGKAELAVAQRAKRAPPRAPGDAPIDMSGYYKVRLKPGTDVEQAAAALAADPNIESAQPDYLATIQSAEPKP